MFWIVLWLALMLGALVFWAVLGRRLWRKTRALGSELNAASAQLDALTAALDGLQDDGAARPAPTLARPAGARARSSAPAPEWDVRRSGRRRTR